MADLSEKGQSKEQKSISIRQPIVTVLGHVDHGKTTLLDYLRKTVVAKREAGNITQEIGATDIPMSVIFDIASEYLEPIRNQVKIPGLLFIDTPGHLAFSAMREKGGAIADLAILIIDITEGLKPQTEESLNILKKCKTPFVIALTKIDRLWGWRNESKDFSVNFKEQQERTKQDFYERFYRIQGELSNQGFNAELFFEVKDFTKEISMVPCSGITGEGIQNLFAVLIGLSQKFLIDKLQLSDVGKGVILELKKDEKLGCNADIILYDGTLKVGDEVMVELEKPIYVKIRALLEPASLQDIRAEKKFVAVKEIKAAAGIKVIGKNIDAAFAGANFTVFRSEEEKMKLLEELEEEHTSNEIDKSIDGIILRTSNIGGLEALMCLFCKACIRRAKVGAPIREDLVMLEDAAPKNRVLICFNVENTFEDLALNKKIKVIQGDVIYKLFEEYEAWVNKLEAEEQADKKQKMKKIVKIKLLPGFVFRKNNPAIVGVEVLAGKLVSGVKLVNSEGKVVGSANQIQKEGEHLKLLEKEEQAAVSFNGVTIGRQVKEGELLYSLISKDDYRELIKCDETDLELLEEIKRILGYM